MKTIRRVAAVLLLGGAVLASSAMLIKAEVTMNGGRPVTAAAPAKLLADGPPPVHDSQNLRVQCWQEGVKIIDREGLQGLSLNSVTRQESVGFKRRDDLQPSTFLLPFNDGLCLIQPDE
jgi:hypothetical protein